WQLGDWSYYLRACPPSPKLLQDLEPILEDYRDEFRYEYHNIVQWLKTFPQLPQELISRVEGYLDGKGFSLYYDRSTGINIWERNWRTCMGENHQKFNSSVKQDRQTDE
ncbi:hypothetical protein B0H13DRAFT_1936687, partial [Mycena leptocephala]